MKFNAFLRRHRSTILDLAGLLAIALAIGAVNIWWAQHETRPPHWDMGKHLFDSLLYYGWASQRHIHDLLFNYVYYPPFVMLQVIPWYFVLGRTVVAAVASNLPYVIVLMFATYGIGRLLGDRLVGLVASVVTLGTPMLVTQFKEYQLDAPTVAMFMVVLYLIIRSDRLRKPSWAMAAGMGFGVGMLTKWTFFLLLWLPLIVIVAENCLAAWRQKRFRLLFGLGLFVVGALLVAGPWYRHNHTALKHDLLDNGITAGVREHDPPVASWASLGWYAHNLASNQLYWALFGLLSIGWIASLRNGSWKGGRLIWLSLLGIYLAFSLLQNKDARYTLPIVPLVVLLGCTGLSAMQPKWRYLYAGALLLYSVVTFVSISFGRPLNTNLLLPNGDVVWASHGYIIGPPSHEQWHQKDMFEFMGRDPGPLKYDALDTIWFNQWGAQYYGLRDGVPFTQDAQAAKYWLLRRWEKDSATPSLDGWSQVASYTLPDNSVVILLQRQH